MKHFLKKTNWAIALIAFLAISLRLFGLNWDQNQHLHPDERFLTMVGAAMKIPNSFRDYLDPKTSTMSPYNVGYSFFVYGSFPLNLTKITGSLLEKNDYWNLHFVGRTFSAFFDVGVVLLVFLLGKRLFGEKVGLWAAFLYAIAVLPIQLSHFFAVDTFLNFFIILAFYLLVLLLERTSPILISLGLGGAIGLAAACKVSALLFLPIVALAYLFLLLSARKKGQRVGIFAGGGLFLLTAYLIFRLSQPQAFAETTFWNIKANPQFVANLKELSSFNNPDSWYPPAVQWKKTTPLVFPLKNLVFWGMGAPLGLLSVVSVFYLGGIILKKLKDNKKEKEKVFMTAGALLIFWTIGLFVYQGMQFCKTMRYFLPIYPFLALSSAWALGEFFGWLKKRVGKAYPLAHFLIFGLLLLYPLSFVSIYTRPITRVLASEWIYQNIAPGSVLANEYWDDPLPLYLPEKAPGQYPGEMLALYDPESSEKWQKINNQLKRADYIILSSNRLYGSIPQNPEYYPQTTKYYQDLFDGRLGFKKVAEFASFPCFPPLSRAWFCLNDQGAEEAFTVYDHPKVMIFKKVELIKD